MSGITSHVLDTSLGKPAAGLVVRLAARTAGAFQDVGRGVTNQDGRVERLHSGLPLAPGVYRLSFETGTYYAALGVTTFYECVEVQFRVGDAAEHYHVPLLLSPFGYSTYRGS